MIELESYIKVELLMAYFIALYNDRKRHIQSQVRVMISRKQFVKRGLTH